MNLPVVYRRAALAEFADAAEWYHRRRVGLGTAFVSAVESIIDRVAGQPDFYPEVYSGVREALVPGFPYAFTTKRKPVGSSSCRYSTPPATRRFGRPECSARHVNSSGMRSSKPSP